MDAWPSHLRSESAASSEKLHLLPAEDSLSLARETLDLSRNGTQRPSTTTPPLPLPVNSGETTDPLTASLQSLPAPASPAAPPTPQPTPTVPPVILSEKARGKLREGFAPPPEGAAAAEEAATLAEQENRELEEELEQLRLGGMGSSGFVPTQEWVTSWQKG